MKKFTSTPTRVTLFFIAFLLQFSCTKDADLLTDYVLADSLVPIEETTNREETQVSVDLASGTIQTNEDNIAVFNISDIANTTSSKSTVLKTIVQPANGEIMIEKDSIIKYMPENDFNGTDMFSYTIEVVNEDNTTIQQENSIEIEVLPVADVVNDAVIIDTENELVIPVLQNDKFSNKEKVVITGTSTPTKGSVLINPDQTLTYKPNLNVAGQDSFTYTTEIDHSDGTVSTETGSVAVTMNTSATGQDFTISADVAYWKELFDAQTNDDDRITALSLSNNNGDLYYFDVSPYVYMFQATGQDSYMDYAIQLFQNRIDNAQLASSLYNSSFTLSYNDSYYTWICNGNGVTGQCQGLTGEIPLNESRGMRTVARMLWVLANSPSYLSKGSNQTIFNSHLAWFEKNIWEKWEVRAASSVLYRSQTHMSSHWAQIAWFLHRITGKQKYRTFYENWSYNGFPAGTNNPGANMRSQLQSVALNGGEGYNWAGSWGNQTGSNDISHANAEVEVMVLGAEHDDYWTTADMEKLSRTLDQLIIKDRTDAFGYPWYINGNSGPSDAKLIQQGWIQLGRFNQSLQDKLSKTSLLPLYYYYQKIEIANLAYNQAFLNSTLYYPEN